MIMPLVVLVVIWCSELDVFISCIPVALPKSYSSYEQCSKDGERAVKERQFQRFECIYAGSASLDFLKQPNKKGNLSG
jgi:hypothetical protein